MFGWLKRLFSPKHNVKLPPFRVQSSHEESTETIDWGLQSLGIPDIWTKTQGEGVTVAVLDTGAALRHPDLKKQIVKTKDFTGDGVSDENGHGTHCAGIVAAARNKLGVVGVAPKAKLIVGKVLGNNGSGSTKWVIEGMRWALDEGADIISMSLGGPINDPALKKIVDDIIAADKILICAAGNEGEGSDTIGYPGAYDGVICVGSIDRNMERSDFSSTGPNITIMAPGEEILSTYPPNRYATLSGTSMATPFVAGLAALILSKHRLHGGETPCENQKEMLEHLTKVALDVEDAGWDRNTGWGIIDPGKSLDHDHD